MFEFGLTFEAIAAGVRAGVSGTLILETVEAEAAGFCMRVMNLRVVSVRFDLTQNHAEIMWLRWACDKDERHHHWNFEPDILRGALNRR
jgi:hypothetical protein